MQATRLTSLDEDDLQYAVAIFDTWQELEAVLEDLGAFQPPCLDALLHARKDSPLRLASALLKNGRQLHFAGLCVTCTRGEIADQLSQRAVDPATSLARALRSLLSRDQAFQLQSHLEKGRLAVWLRLTRPQGLSVCASLVRASPHVVDVCKTKAKVRS
jgi:hypothetical protein